MQPMKQFVCEVHGEPVDRLFDHMVSVDHDISDHTLSG
jgi:hypothetical protein